ncbi:MAG: 50S ribosomal protein L29, partial [Planctomycetales bacterium]|nr:50S ribosomal protein L29 [Planctomycetales bacterium]
MSDEQLELTLKETEQTMFRLRIKAQTEPTKAPTERRSHRRTIARIKTLQTQRSKTK